MIRRILAHGWRRARAFWYLSLIHYLGTAVVAGGVVVVVAWLIVQSAGPSLAPAVLGAGPDHTVLTDLPGFSYRGTVGWTLLAGAVLTAALHLLLAGGIIGTMMPGARRSLWHFVASSLAYAGRFVRLALIGALLTAVLALLAGLVVLVILPALGASPENERDIALRWAGALAAVLALGGGVWALVDYARVLIVRDRMGSARAALRRAGRLFLAHPLVVAAPPCAAAAAVGATLAVQALIGTPAPMDTSLGVLAVAAVHQAFVAGRAFVRVAMIGSQISVVEVTGPAPPPPVPDRQG